MIWKNHLLVFSYFSKKSSFCLKNKLFLFNNKVTEIRQEDFKNGPLIIKEPGQYKLMENIIFEPNKHNMGKPTKEQLKKLPIEFREPSNYEEVVINKKIEKPKFKVNLEKSNVNLP